MADVLISGGGIAGAALAIMLGRAGLAVELFERDRFPREKPCGEGIMPAGVAVLERLGLVDAVGGRPFYGVRYHLAGRVLEAAFPRADRGPRTGLAQRRRRLDRALFEAAASTPGVRAHPGTVVDGPVVSDGRVGGLRVAGERVRAPLVIAADGARSSLRRTLGLDGRPPRRVRVGLRAHFRLAGGRRQPPWVEVFVGEGHELYVGPLPGGEVLVAGLADAARLRAGAVATFAGWVAEHPPLAERLAGAERLTAFRGRAPLASPARSGMAPGIVLLGDAAGYLDPITGGGIAQALTTAELLAHYVPRILDEGDGWLRRFERERRALLRDYKLVTRLVLTLAARPWMARAAFRLLGARPGLASHLVGVAGGVRPLLPSTRLAVSRRHVARARAR